MFFLLKFLLELCLVGTVSIIRQDVLKRVIVVYLAQFFPEYLQLQQRTETEVVRSRQKCCFDQCGL